MLAWERRVALRHYLDEGLTVTDISSDLGISRYTTYRPINTEKLDRNVDEGRFRSRRAG